MTKITIERATVEQALEALKKAHPYSNSNKDLDGHSEAITALRQALEQPQQEHSEDSLDMVKVRQIAREYAWPNSEIDAGNLYWALHVALRQLDHIGGTKEMVTEQPQQEPVAWMYTSHWKGDEIFITRYQSELTTYKADKVWPLYTRPPVIDKSAAIRIATALGWEPKREWVGLTMEDKKRILESDFGGSRLDCMDEAEKILKEKNT